MPSRKPAQSARFDQQILFLRGCFTSDRRSSSSSSSSSKSSLMRHQRWPPEVDMRSGCAILVLTHNRNCSRGDYLLWIRAKLHEAVISRAQSPPAKEATIFQQASLTSPDERSSYTVLVSIRKATLAARTARATFSNSCLVRKQHAASPSEGLLIAPSHVVYEVQHLCTRTQSHGRQVPAFASDAAAAWQ